MIAKYLKNGLWYRLGYYEGKLGSQDFPFGVALCSLNSKCTPLKEWHSPKI